MSDTSTQPEKLGEKRPFELQYEIDERPKISILDLMLITGACAVTITLVRSAGITGILILFAACVAVTYWHRQKCSNPTRYRFWNQFTWGMLMPIGCIFGDPFIFGRFDQGVPMHFESHAVACYVFIAYQILALAVSWVIVPDSRIMNSAVAGTLYAGAAFAFLVAMMMLPITIAGAIVLIGLIGLTPWATGIVYAGTARMHARRRGKPLMIPMVTAFIIPFAIAFLVLAISDPIPHRGFP